MLHFTDGDGHKAIRSQVEWTFRASSPPGDHARGAYFTTLLPATKNLAARLRIPKRKTEFMFAFTGSQGLQPLEGGRGQYVFWSKVDYVVSEDRQTYEGSSEAYQ